MPATSGQYQVRTLPFYLASTHKALVLLSVFFLSACGVQTTKEAVNPADAVSPSSPLITSEFNRHSAAKDQIGALLNAEFMLQREGPNKAFGAFYQIALSSNSNDLPWIERLVRIAVASQNLMHIEKSTNLWLAAAPDAEAAYALKFQVLIKGNRIPEATTLLTTAQQLSVSLQFLPRYLEDNIRDGEQIDVIEKTLAALPVQSKQDPYVRLSQAHLLLLSGQYHQAIEASNALLQQENVEKTEALYLIKAFSLRNINQIKSAIETLEEATTQLPNRSQLITPLVDFLVIDGRGEQALERFKSTDLKAVEQFQVGINLMRAFIEHQQPERALTTANQLPKEQAELSDQVQYLTAIALAQQDKREKAIQIMEGVTGTLQANATNQIAIWLYEENKPELVNTMVLKRTQRANMPEQIDVISMLHEDEGNIDLSYDLICRALDLLPASNVLRYRKALLADLIGQWKVTEKELSILVAKEPDNAQYLNALGYTLLTRTPRLDEAMAYIESAYEKSDNDPAIIDSLGWGFFLQGELERSSYYLKKAWSILPDADIAAHYGESLWAQQHYMEAMTVWQNALDASPEAPLLLDTIKRLSPSLLKDST
ncbi:tetratricopeptide repeat protein [Marinomonas algarum]|uniref:Tetratricopeptide repeat protein n=1 Tax=Marinomonas algarum TaxID=2883105 RepID=A0A9X1LDS6_9GAMM|nr:tetratricopeptide repeat protein [Marinomonas algarum]MCB5162897.1 tetratricopeptide repeat protein [Marinomonas algarum]